MATTVSDADIRVQLQRYLDAGESARDFNVDGILQDVMEIIREHGHTSIDSIDGEVFARIVQRWDTSAQTIRADMTAPLEQVAAFFKARPHIPAPHSYTVQVRVDSKAELDALAGDYGRPPTTIYMNGDRQAAQFSVYLDGAEPDLYLMVLFHWNER